ncbi:MAG: NAD-dependent epimerase/dehydratase family protein [Gemmatimonadaceae bacterium]
MKIFVTGATGVIGRRAVPLLVQRGHHVTGVSRSPQKSSELARAGAEPVQVDLFDLDAVRAAVKGHDAIINLATSIPPSSKVFLPWAWRPTGRIRRYVSANVASAARQTGVERLLQESFGPIYASGGDKWLTETSPVKPVRYNRTVLDAERAASNFSASGGTGIILRFAGFYGPDSDFTRDQIDLVRKGWAPVLGSADGYIPLVTHDDAARAVVHLLSAPAGTYNVADDEPLTKRECYQSLARLLRVEKLRFPPPWIFHLLGSLGELLSRSQRISNQKLRSTGWAPKYSSAREGWKATLADIPRAKSK